MSWPTKNGDKTANYFGSVTQASTCRLGGHGPNCVDTYVPFSAMLPMVSPNDLVIGGWDISSMNLADAMRRSKARAAAGVGGFFEGVTTGVTTFLSNPTECLGFKRQ